MAKGQASELKEYNRRLVYGLLRSKKTVSKAQISRLTNISAPTVGRIIDYFKEIGILEDAGEGVSSLGRKPSLLMFMPSAALSIGAEFDGVHLQMGLTNLAGDIIKLETLRVPRSIKDFLYEAFVPAVQRFIEKSGFPTHLIKGIGLGLPGAVNKQRDGHHTLQYAPFVGVEDEYELNHALEYLEAELGMRIFVENDANSAALGEYAIRFLGQTSDLLYIKIGQGLGSGIILEGVLRKGETSFAGELGYLVFDSDFAAKPGKPGWLESKIDSPGMWQQLSSIEQSSDSMLSQMANYLSLAIINVCVSLEIHTVVIGGVGLASVESNLVAAVRKKLDQLSAIEIFCDTPKSPAPGISGVAALATESWLEQVFAQ